MYICIYVCFLIRLRVEWHVCCHYEWKCFAMDSCVLSMLATTAMLIQNILNKFHVLNASHCVALCIVNGRKL